MTEHLTSNNGGNLNWQQIMRWLVDSGEAMLNSQPVTITIQPFEYVVTDQSDGGWCVTTSPHLMREEWGDDCEYATEWNQGIAVVDEENHRLAWFDTIGNDSDLFEELSEEGISFLPADRERLLNKLTTLTGNRTVRLPDSLLAEQRDELIQNVLMLRLKKDGVMLATLCVRDSRERLMLPGEGAPLRHDSDKKQLVQIRRDLTKERSDAEDLCAALQLDEHQTAGDWTWVLTSPDDVSNLLRTAGELVADEKLSLMWHKNSAKRLNVVGSVSASSLSVRVAKQRDWFGVNGTCRIGDREVPLQEVLAGLQGSTSAEGFIQVGKDEWASIADDFRSALQQLADAATENRGKLKLDASAAMSLSELEDSQLQIKADKAWKQCLDKVRTIETISPDPPATLNCDLRDYQVEGFRWMCRLAEWGVGGILADDMGLGKTVQTLAVLLQRIESGPALVIAPTSLGYNWESECQKFAPSLTPRLLREADRGQLIADATEGDVVICSYGLALRETELLQSIDWGTLVLDEAQNVKNSTTKTAKEIRKLSAGWKVALTGTPMENHLGELWSIFRAVSPGILGSWEQFRKKFASPIEKDNDNERRQALSHFISPFVLRRTKKQVLTDLPDRREVNLMVDLSKEEQKRYDNVRLAAVGELDDLGSDDLSSDQRFRILQLLTRLRQIACHVGMMDDTWNKGSSKLSLLMSKLQELKEQGHRALIFSQFTSHLALIRQAVEEAGIEYQYLDGQTTAKARRKRVGEFQDGKGDVFLISLKAGGTGLNLTAADFVIHMDPWWNPAVEDQATDRAHRIGQKNNVMVYRIISKGTIEEQIISLHAEKRDLVEGILSGSEASAKLSTEELASLIRDGITVGA